MAEDIRHGAAVRTSDLLKGVETSQSTPGPVYATQGQRITEAVRCCSRAPIAVGHWSRVSLPASGQTDRGFPRSIRTTAQRCTCACTPARADSIVITTDGGQTFRTALAIQGIHLVPTRERRSTLRRDDRRQPLRAAFGSTSFVERAGPHLRCLGAAAGHSRIYACGDMFLDGFSLGTSDDGGQTFQRVMKFSELLGPLTCSTVQTACAAHWERIQQVLGIGSPDAGRPDGGSVDAGAPSSGRPASSCATGGAGGSAFLLLVLFARRTRRSRRHAPR